LELQFSFRGLHAYLLINRTRFDIVCNFYQSVYSGRANGIDISDHLSPSGKVIWNWFKKNISSNYNLTRFYANAHTYGIEGYPHTDSIRKDDKTIVIYLNREWKREWGGETVIYSDDDKEYDIELSQLPGYNRAIMFDGYKWHCARSVTRICPVLRVTLILKVVPIDCDKMRYKIQKFLSTYGCFSKTHRQDSLAAHLLGVYDILKRKGLDDDICAAGGLHSIFGTSQYLKSTLNSNNRNLLVNLIGETTTKYVELFSTLDRPKTIEKALKELYVSNNIQVSISFILFMLTIMVILHIYYHIYLKGIQRSCFRINWWNTNQNQLCFFSGLSHDRICKYISAEIWD